MNLRESIFRRLDKAHIYAFLIWLCMVGLLFSVFLLSVAQLLLIAFWIFDGPLYPKFKDLFTNPLVLSLISIYFLHLLGMVWSSDWQYGLKDLRVKLPLLSFPLLFAALNPMKDRLFRTTLMVFVGLTMLAALICSLAFFINPVDDLRKISLFGSHIRFSLMICLSVFVIFNLLINNHFRFGVVFLLVLSAIGLIAFLFLLNSMTGIVVLVFVALYLMFRYLGRIKNIGIRLAVFLLVLSLPGFIAYEYYLIRKTCFPEVHTYSLNEVDLYSPRNNMYYHDTTCTVAENGNYVYSYIAYDEIYKAWEARTGVHIDPETNIGKHQRDVLFRYLSSKGYRKDFDGVRALSNEDISLIQQGIPNCNIPDMNLLEYRIYTLVWEFDVYSNSGDPSGLTLMQRMEYLKASKMLIEKHPYFGIGTGDMKMAFKEQYIEMGTLLEPGFRNRSHNQFVSFTVAFGFAGLLLFLWVLIFPFIQRKYTVSSWYAGFFLIFVISLINEDTLETQTGVTFYALFNAFFLFLDPASHSKTIKDKNHDSTQT